MSMINRTSNAGVETFLIECSRANSLEGMNVAEDAIRKKAEGSNSGLASKFNASWTNKVNFKLRKGDRVSLHAVAINSRGANANVIEFTGDQVQGKEYADDQCLLELCFWIKNSGKNCISIPVSLPSGAADGVATCAAEVANPADHMDDTRPMGDYGNRTRCIAGSPYGGHTPFRPPFWSWNCESNYYKYTGTSGYFGSNPYISNNVGERWSVGRPSRWTLRQVHAFNADVAGGCNPPVPQYTIGTMGGSNDPGQNAAIFQEGGWFMVSSRNVSAAPAPLGLPVQPQVGTAANKVCLLGANYQTPPFGAGSNGNGQDLYTRMYGAYGWHCSYADGLYGGNTATAIGQPRDYNNNSLWFQHNTWQSLFGSPGQHGYWGGGCEFYYFKFNERYTYIHAGNCMNAGTTTPVPRLVVESASAAITTDPFESCPISNNYKAGWQFAYYGMDPTLTPPTPPATNIAYLKSTPWRSINAECAMDNKIYIMTRADYSGPALKTPGTNDLTGPVVGMQGQINNPDAYPMTAFLIIKAENRYEDVNNLAAQITDALHRTFPISDGTRAIPDEQNPGLGATPMQCLPFTQDFGNSLDGGSNEETGVMWNKIARAFVGPCLQVRPANFTIGPDLRYLSPDQSFQAYEQREGPKEEHTYLNVGSDRCWNNQIWGNMGVKDIYKFLHGDQVMRCDVFNLNTTLVPNRNCDRPVLVNHKFRYRTTTSGTGYNGTYFDSHTLTATAQISDCRFGGYKYGPMEAPGIPNQLTYLGQNQLIMTNILYTEANIKRFAKWIRYTEKYAGTEVGRSAQVADATNWCWCADVGMTDDYYSEANEQWAGGQPVPAIFTTQLNGTYTNINGLLAQWYDSKYRIMPYKTMDWNYNDYRDVENAGGGVFGAVVGIIPPFLPGFAPGMGAGLASMDINSPCHVPVYNGGVPAGDIYAVLYWNNVLTPTGNPTDFMKRFPTAIGSSLRLGCCFDIGRTSPTSAYPATFNVGSTLIHAGTDNYQKSTWVAGITPNQFACVAYGSVYRAGAGPAANPISVVDGAGNDYTNSYRPYKQGSSVSPAYCINSISSIEEGQRISQELGRLWVSSRFEEGWDDFPQYRTANVQQRPYGLYCEDGNENAPILPPAPPVYPPRPQGGLAAFHKYSNTGDGHPDNYLLEKAGGLYDPDPLVTDKMGLSRKYNVGCYPYYYTLRGEGAAPPFAVGNPDFTPQLCMAFLVKSPVPPGCPTDDPDSPNAIADGIFYGPGKWIKYNANYKQVSYYDPLCCDYVPDTAALLADPLRPIFGPDLPITFNIGNLSWGDPFGLSYAFQDLHSVVPINRDDQKLRTYFAPPPGVALETPLSRSSMCNYPNYMWIGANDGTCVYDDQKSRFGFTNFHTAKLLAYSDFENLNGKQTTNVVQAGARVAAIDFASVVNPTIIGDWHVWTTGNVPNTLPEFRDPWEVTGVAPKPGLAQTKTGYGYQLNQQGINDSISGICIFKAWLCPANWIPPKGVTDKFLANYFSKEAPTDPLLFPPYAAAADIRHLLPLEMTQFNYDLITMGPLNRQPLTAAIGPGLLRYGDHRGPFLVEADEDNFEGSILAKMGFSVDQISNKAHCGSQECRFSETTYANHEAETCNLSIKPFTTNENITISDQLYSNILYQQTMDSSANNFIGLPNYGLGFQNNLPIVLASQTAELTAQYLPELFSQPYFMVYSDICRQMYMGGTEGADVQLPCIGICLKNYTEGDFFYGYGASYTKMIDYDRNLGSVLTEVRNPINGELCSLDGKSSIVYRVDRDVEFIAPVLAPDGEITAAGEATAGDVGELSEALQDMVSAGSKSYGGGAMATSTGGGGGAANVPPASVNVPPVVAQMLPAFQNPEVAARQQIANDDNTRNAFTNVLQMLQKRLGEVKEGTPEYEAAEERLQALQLIGEQQQAGQKLAGAGVMLDAVVGDDLGPVNYIESMLGGPGDSINPAMDGGGGETKSSGYTAETSMPQYNRFNIQARSQRIINNEMLIASWLQNLPITEKMRNDMGMTAVSGTKESGEGTLTNVPQAFLRQWGEQLARNLMDLRRQTSVVISMARERLIKGTPPDWVSLNAEIMRQTALGQSFMLAPGTGAGGRNRPRYILRSKLRAGGDSPHYSDRPRRHSSTSLRRFAELIMDSNFVKELAFGVESGANADVKTAQEHIPGEGDLTLARFIRNELGEFVAEGGLQLDWTRGVAMGSRQRGGRKTAGTESEAFRDAQRAGRLEYGGDDMKNFITAKDIVLQRQLSERTLTLDDVRSRTSNMTAGGGGGGSTNYERGSALRRALGVGSRTQTQHRETGGESKGRDKGGETPGPHTHTKELLMQARARARARATPEHIAQKRALLGTAALVRSQSAGSAVGRHDRLSTSAGSREGRGETATPTSSQLKEKAKEKRELFRK